MPRCSQQDEVLLLQLRAAHPSKQKQYVANLRMDVGKGERLWLYFSIPLRYDGVRKKAPTTNRALYEP